MTLRQTASFSEISRHARRTREITKQIFIKTSNFSIFFSLFLANSKGKDKFIALFQYLFQFICLCGKHSSIPEFAQAYKKQELLDMVVYYNLKENLSSARKVFRLFRFLDEIKGLAKILKTNKPFGFKIISIITYCCSITYYISDNMLWFLNILVRSKAIEKNVSKRWKQRKNYSSYFRVLTYTTILIYSIILQKEEISSNEKYLLKSINQIETNPIAEEKSYEQLLDGRRKIRFFYLEIALSVFRFLMLTKSLKLIGHNSLDPIFIGVCGLCSAILGFLKALLEKKIVINLQKKNQKQTQKKNYSPSKILKSIEQNHLW